MISFCTKIFKNNVPVPIKIPVIIIHFKSFKQSINNLLFDFFFSISGSLGSCPHWKHCILFLGETLYSQSASVSTQVYQIGTGKLNAGGNPVMD